MLEAVPFQVRTILTASHLCKPHLPGNGIQVAGQARNHNIIYPHPMRFHMVCDVNRIKPRLTTPNQPRTAGQVERIDRTIKGATAKRLHYENHAQLRTHLANVIAAYKSPQRAKTLSGYVSHPGR